MQICFHFFFFPHESLLLKIGVATHHSIKLLWIMGYCQNIYVNWLPAVECKQKMLNSRKKLISQEKQTNRPATTTETSKQANNQKAPEKNKWRVYRSTIKKIYRLLLSSIVTIIFEKPNHCPTKKTTGHICILLRMLEKNQMAIWSSSS